MSIAIRRRMHSGFVPRKQSEHRGPNNVSLACLAIGVELIASQKSELEELIGERELLLGVY